MTGFGTQRREASVLKPSDGPGPAQYNNGSHNTIGETVSKLTVKNNSSFGPTYDIWDPVCYHGQESHYYGRLGKGPGAYFNQDQLDKVAQKSHQYSVPKNDRGLLNPRKSALPGPLSYENDTLRIKRREARGTMGKATRDIFFGQFGGAARGGGV